MVYFYRCKAFCGVVAVLLVREEGGGQSAYKHALNCGDDKMHENFDGM